MLSADDVVIVSHAFRPIHGDIWHFNGQNRSTLTACISVIFEAIGYSDSLIHNPECYPYESVGIAKINYEDFS